MTEYAYEIAIKTLFAKDFPDVTNAETSQEEYKNIKISKRAISGEDEIVGVKICVYEYDIDKKEKIQENAYECFESGNTPYEFYASPGDYILEEIVTPKGYESITIGFVFSVLDDFKISLKDVKSDLIKLNDQKDMIILYNVPVKEVQVASTGKSLRIVYLLVGIILIGLGSILLYTKYKKVSLKD